MEQMTKEELQEFFDYFVKARDISVLDYIPARRQEFFANKMMNRIEEISTQPGNNQGNLHQKSDN